MLFVVLVACLLLLLLLLSAINSSEREIKESRTDKTIIVAMVFCAGMFAFISGFFCILFKKKLERKKRKRHQGNSSRRRQRQPYRQQKPVGKHGTQHMPESSELGEGATSRFVHHDATGILPPLQLQSTGLYRTSIVPASQQQPPKNNGHHAIEEQTFYG